MTDLTDAERAYQDFIRDGIKGTVRWERAEWHEQRAIDLADAALAALRDRSDKFEGWMHAAITGAHKWRQRAEQAEATMHALEGEKKREKKLRVKAEDDRDFRAKQVEILRGKLHQAEARVAELEKELAEQTTLKNEFMHDAQDLQAEVERQKKELQLRWESKEAAWAEVERLRCLVLSAHGGDCHCSVCEEARGVAEGGKG